MNVHTHTETILPQILAHSYMVVLLYATVCSVKLRIRTECQQFTLEEKEEAMDTVNNPTPPLSRPHHLKSHNLTSAHQLQEQETSE